MIISRFADKLLSILPSQFYFMRVFVREIYVFRWCFITHVEYFKALSVSIK